MLRTAVAPERRRAKIVPRRAHRPGALPLHARVVGGPDETDIVLGDLDLEDLVDGVADAGPLEQGCGVPRHDGGQQQERTGVARPDTFVGTAAASHGGRLPKDEKEEESDRPWLASFV